MAAVDRDERPHFEGEPRMKRFHAYRLLSALSAIAAVVIASGAGNKFF